MRSIHPVPTAWPRLLVCFDLDAIATRVEAPLIAAQVSSNCRRILDHARARGWTVVHVRRQGEPGQETPASALGLEPLPSEPLFVQSGLSAFSNPAFRKLAEQYGRGELLLIGCSSTSTCLATALTAYDHNLSVVLVTDAVASTQLEAQGLDAMNALTQNVDKPLMSLVRTRDLLGEARRLTLVHSR